MSKKELLKSNQDSAWKEILDFYFKEFMEFFYPDVATKIDWLAPYEPLDNELQSITTDAMVGKTFVDKLMKVKSLEGKDEVVLIHIEVQGQKEEEFSKRLFQYYCKLFTKYDQSILTLAILTDSNQSWHPKDYQRDVFDFSVLTFNFKTHKLIDYRTKKQTLEETRSDLEARFRMKFWLTRRLYEKGYNRDYVINLFKVIDWVLVLPKDLALEYKEKIHKLEEAKKVSYITSIEQLGREEGLQLGREEGLQLGRKEGLQQGREEGRHEEAIAIAKNLLNDGMSPKAIQKLTGLSEKEIMALVDKH
ncbi:MAG: hypothetical protein E6K54_08195 [Gammaproteobacteria bacterium]|nr:MAG: hypothetical protein E6K54_08195 [Gammaproteobacteria bacterium]